jgi:hypothetical protein
MYESLMSGSFWWCVRLLQDLSKLMGITYEELNIWVFVIVHPLVTIVLFIWVLSLRQRLRRQTS